MPELKTIDGIKVLFVDEKFNPREEILKHKHEDIGLVVVGGNVEGGSKLALEKLLQGRSLSEFIKTEREKPESKPLSEIINEDSMLNKVFKIEALPTFNEPFIPHLPKPHQQRKWYEKRKRK